MVYPTVVGAHASLGDGQGGESCIITWLEALSVAASAFFSHREEQLRIFPGGMRGTLIRTSAR